MAKIVIAGKADCPYYARAELLGDKLSRNLPDFKLHKIVQQPGDWEEWLKTTCVERGWSHAKSPLVWRELIDRGGKGVLIGGANEFQEYAKGYYGVQSELLSNDMRKIATENLQYKIDGDEEEAEYKAQSKPLHVCITNASSNVCYGMLNDIAKGDVFGQKTEVFLHLYDEEDKMEALEGIEMEAMDLAHTLLRGGKLVSDIQEAFRDCGAIILLDEVKQAEGQSYEDWIKANSELYVKYAKIINETALKNVKVLIAGSGPVNFNTYMMIKSAPSIPRQNFAGLARVVENQAKAVIAERLQVNTAGVVDLILWGNVNGEHFLDMDTCRVHGYEGAIWGPPSFSLPTAEMVFDKKWLETEFLELVKTREEKMVELLKHEPAFSKSSAITTMLEHWWNGSPSGQMFSLAVCSEGWYGVPKGLVYSFPVTMHPKGYWYVVQDIEVTDERREKILAPVKDLKKEIEVIFPPPKPPTPPPSEDQNKESASGDTADNKDDQSEQDNKEETDEEGDKQDSDNEKRLETILEDKVGETKVAEPETTPETAQPETAQPETAQPETAEPETTA